MMKKAALCLILAFCATAVTAGPGHKHPKYPKPDRGGYAKVPVDCEGTPSEKAVFTPAGSIEYTDTGALDGWTVHYVVDPREAGTLVDGACTIYGLMDWPIYTNYPEEFIFNTPALDVCHLYMGKVRQKKNEPIEYGRHYQTPHFYATIYEDGSAVLVCRTIEDQPDYEVVNEEDPSDKAIQAGCTTLCHSP